MKPFFSIVIPIYNASRYLDNCINSVLNQSFGNFELILVDDCSDDDSYDICTSFAKIDKRIILLKNIKNVGVSKSRNLGIKCSRGNYLGFIDADDWIDINLLEHIYKELQSEEVECLKFGATEEYFDNDGNIKSIVRCIPKATVCGDLKSIQDEQVVLFNQFLFGYLWNTFYKTSVIKNYKLYLNENIKVNEDFDFNMRCFKYIRLLKVISICGYHYAKREGNSLSSQKSNYSYDVHMKKIIAFLNVLEDSDNLSQENLEKIFWMYTRFVYASLENGESFDYIKKQVLFQKFLEIDFRNVSNKQRIMITVLKTKNKVLIMLFLRVISLVKSATPNLFARIKR